MSKGLEKLGSALTSIRVWTVNLLTLAFLVYILVIVVAVFSQRGPRVEPDGRVLILAPEGSVVDQAALSLIHISEPTRPVGISRMPSSA